MNQNDIAKDVIRNKAFLTGLPPVQRKLVKWGSHTVEPLASACVRARPTKIRAGIAKLELFFASKLPGTIKSLKSSILPDNRTNSTTSHASGEPATVQQSTFDLQQNACLEASFSKELADSLAVQFKAGHGVGEHVPVNIGEGKSVTVSHCFARDVPGHFNAFYYDGNKISEEINAPQPKDHINNSNEFEKQWQNIILVRYLIEQGVTANDILEISKVCNQSAYATLSIEMMHHDLVMELPGNKQAVLSSELPSEWHINPVVDGYDVVLSAKGDLKHLPTKSGEIQHFSEDSKMEQEIKIHFRRDSEGKLEVKDVSGSIQVKAWSEDGKPLTPSAAREASQD